MQLFAVMRFMTSQVVIPEKLRLHLRLGLRFRLC